VESGWLPEEAKCENEVNRFGLCGDAVSARTDEVWFGRRGMKRPGQRWRVEAGVELGGGFCN
jgi:hypothetical protein